MNQTNFKHLYYFYIVAKEGSIKDASNKLFVSQPTISDQIKLLEEHFECKLFDRKQRNLVLTDEGSLTLDYAEKIFSTSRELTQILKNKLEGPKKSIDIGITHFMSQYFLYENLVSLFQQNELTVNIHENERRYLLADLEEGNLDLVFTDNKGSLSKNMDAYLFGINRTYAVAHKKFKPFKKQYPHSLNDIPFFNYTTNSSLRYEIELYFAKNNIAPKVIGEGDNIDIFEVILNKGLAFAILPEAAKNRLSNTSDVIVLGEITDLQSHVWGIIQRKYKGIGFELISKKQHKK